MKKDTKSTSCQQVRIAYSGMGEVSICPDCGVVHVALQYFSMRFELEAFRTLQHMLSEAQDKIGQAQTPQSAEEIFAAVSGEGEFKAVVH